LFSVHHSLKDTTVSNDKDPDEFLNAMRGIKPLRSDARVPETRPKPKPKAKFSKADERQVLAESLEDDIDTIEHGYGAALRFHRQHVGKRTMRKLQRGGYSVQAEIDLHGMTVDEARPRLADFRENIAFVLYTAKDSALGIADRF
jgi:DNA-nicking Smr family endonuclease